MSVGTNGKKLKRGATVVLESMFYPGVWYGAGRRQNKDIPNIKWVNIRRDLRDLQDGASHFHILSIQ